MGLSRLVPEGAQLLEKTDHEIHDSGTKKEMIQRRRNEA
jgi:hypothetical protein